MKQRFYTPRELVPLALVAALVAGCSVAMPSFARMSNYMNILKQSSFTGIATVGMLFVLVVGEMDLSVGAQFAFYGMLCAFFMSTLGLPVIPSILLTLLAALAVGGGIGYCIGKIQAKALLATIAVSVALQGFSQILGSGTPIFNLPQSLIAAVGFQMGGISLPVLLMALMAVVGAVILHQTYYGKFFFAVGVNSYAAEKSGISVSRSKILAFSLSSFFTAVAAVAYLGRIGSASFTAGANMELDVLTAAALSGIGFHGGKGKVLPLLSGAIFLGVLSSAFIALNVAPYYQNVIKGTVLLCAILTNFTKS